MTIASNLNKHIYEGNGATTQWPFAFRLLNADHLQVWIVDSTGTETQLTTGYNILPAGGVYPCDSGEVEYPAQESPQLPVLPDGSKIVLLRVLDLTQGTSYPNSGGLYPKTIENDFDKITMVVQQIDEKVARCVKMPIDTPLDATPDAGSILEGAIVARAAAEEAATAAAESEENAATSAATAATLNQTTQTSITALQNQVNSIQIAQGAGMLGFSTKAAMDADLAHAANTPAFVTNDTTATNNGFYIKNGASGSGSWTKSTFVVTSDARTRLGERAAIICAGGIPDIVYTSTDRYIAFKSNTIVYSGKNKYTLSSATNVTLDTTKQNHYIFMDITTGVFTVVTAIANLSTLTENNVYVATLYFSATTTLKSIDIGCNYTLNGLTGGLGASKTDVKVTIACANNVPNIIATKDAKGIEFDVGTVIIYGNSVYSLSSATTLTFDATKNNAYVYFDTIGHTFDVKYVSTDISSVGPGYVHIATINYYLGAAKNINIPCSYTVNGTTGGAAVKTPQNSTIWFSSEDIGNYYTATSSPGVDNGGFSNLNATTPYNTFIQAWRDFASGNSSYITETYLGKDSSNTYDMYKYSFAPPALSVDAAPAATMQPMMKNYPKILIVSGMHGEEKVSAFSLYWFMKNVAENWSSDPFLEYLHWNVSFEIIPYCNPSGYMFGVSGTRKNNNGVDINRNFDSKWGVVTDPSQPEYCGPSPFSEVEAQYIRDMILANLDAALFFDFHMSGESGSGWTNVCWMAMPNLKTEYFPNIVRAFKTVLSKCSRAWRTNRSFDPSQTYYGYVSIADYGGTATRYAHSQGIPGCLFECAKMLPTHGGVIGKSEIITVSKEIAGNAILNMLKVAKESPLK